MKKTPIWQEVYEKFSINNHIDVPVGNGFVDLLQPKIEQYGEQVAFRMGQASLTFAQLDVASRRFAAFLQMQGLVKGERVAVQLPNILQYPVIILACLRVGAVLVNINPLYTKYELAYQLTDAGVTGLVILEGMSSAYESLDTEVKEKLSWVIRCQPHADIEALTQIDPSQEMDKKANTAHFFNSDDASQTSPTQIQFADVMNGYVAQQYQYYPLDDEALALLQYTGGTTGKPKGAMLTHGNIMANLLQCYEMFGKAVNEQAQTSQVKILNPLPLYHIFSFAVSGMLGIYAGWQNLLITNPRDIETVVDNIAQHRPHVIPSVNTLFAAMLNHPKFSSLDFSQLVLTIGGGTAIIRAIAEQWKQVTGQTINEGLGMSETSPVIAFNPLGTTDFNGSVGVPLPCTDVKIIDDTGKECAIGERGEVCIKGPQVMQGYWHYNNDETFTDDGYFKSGDIGLMDEAGYLTLVDRKKDMILVSGFNVYPNEVEAALTEHEKVLEVAVIGVADERSGEVPKAFVVKKDDSLSVDELMAFATERLTNYKRPRYYEFLTELPKSMVGKILRKVY
ncbi:AMP-binding protein [Psychrobacter sp. I-STPA6b]|uniref:AMP-binding protein n=1 Tax=Psychrobacter sp. I-STPA6b TaxID=2585718 RepID=UPI001D0C602B|nr:AMP-binding protein [Psychrobacter sp. I-STPA6b]